MIRPTRPIKLKLFLIRLTALELAGGWMVRLGPIKTDCMNVEADGAEKVNMDHLDASILRADMGAGTLKMAGKVTTQEVRVSGGQYQAGDLDSRTAKVEVGGGKATVWVRDRLQVTFTHGGTVSYFGRPKVTQNTTYLTGTGTVVSLGER